jgi:hypothetical protein
MLAEKAADLIAGNEPLPRQRTPFYRHGVSPLEDPSRDAGGDSQAPVSAPGGRGAARRSPGRRWRGSAD